MFKNNVNYKNLFKTLGLGGMLLIASCDKSENECNDPYDPSCGNYNPKLAKIDALRADSTRLAGEVRAAVLPAKTVPYDISGYFDGKFGKTAAGTLPTNLPDSARILMNVVEQLWDEYGNPPPFNDETLRALHTKSGNYIMTIDELKKLCTR